MTTPKTLRSKGQAADKAQALATESGREMYIMGPVGHGKWYVYPVTDAMPLMIVDSRKHGYVFGPK